MRVTQSREREITYIVDQSLRGGCTRGEHRERVGRRAGRSRGADIAPLISNAYHILHCVFNEHFSANMILNRSNGYEIMNWTSMFFFSRYTTGSCNHSNILRTPDVCIFSVEDCVDPER